ncbi:unnamed protein product [Paramecium sonneborni]|uniref:RNA helicase n=1 Tax=Paramecium sonneborni TaxID=65129 RepID=A0A8S1MY87_9CILI|nr:unnamed protein product [Paramecium sonneborni]
MNSHYVDDVDEYNLDNEESIRSKWKETRGCKIGLKSQDFQPFRKEFLHKNQESYMMTEERIEAFYREKEIIIKTLENQKVPPPYLSWASANFPSPILDSIEQLQFKNPTVIQSVVFPIILAGYDVIGVAQTGSGKTIAYLLPGLIQITNQINEESNNTKKQNSPQMLILVPTRELAIQIDSEIQLFTQNYRLKTVCVYGGLNNRKTQYFNLGKSPNILVATPGRLLDFLKERVITLTDVSYLVIDEADRLLEMGFEDTTREIVQQIREDRQTVLFSATWPKAVKNLAFDFCQQSPIYVQIGKSNLTINKNIEQEIICLFQREKLKSLLSILDTLKISDKVLIFSEQRYRCEQLAINMADMGYYTIALHGDKTQPQRDEIMKAFRSGQTRLLCATDLASRGLDVTDITVVINYDFPKYFDDYIHRIGRTGRGEKKGKSFSFLAYDKDESYMAREILKLASITNLKYDEFALLNFAKGILPQIRNDFESDRFIQQQPGNYSQKVNFTFPKNSKEQYNYDLQKFKNPQENRNYQNDKNYRQFQSVQNQKEDSSFRDSNHNFNFQNNEKYQEQNNQINRSQYQRNNQQSENRNHKNYNCEMAEDGQNYYQKEEIKYPNGKQERVDRQNRQEESYNLNNKFGSDCQNRFYQNDRFDKQNRQERQFRQQEQDRSSRLETQQRQIDKEIQDKQEYIENKYDRQNNNYKNDRREFRQQEEMRRVFNDKQEKPFRQYEKSERSERQFENNRGNRRVNFINQDEDRLENSKDQEISLKQQQTKIIFDSNQQRWDNQRNAQLEDFRQNSKYMSQSQQISGFKNNIKSYENHGEDFKNFRQEEYKRQHYNHDDERHSKSQFHSRYEKIDQINNFKDQQNKNQVKFQKGDDDYKTKNFNRFQEQEENDRPQKFRNFDSRNNNYQSQGKHYYDQNEKQGQANFRNQRQPYNEQFEYNNNSRQQKDQQNNSFNRVNRNQIEYSNNDNNKFKSYRNTQSLERNEQFRFFNSKHITQNVTSADDQFNNFNKQRSEENNLQRNRNQNQQNLVDFKENRFNINQGQNLEESKKQSLSINENQDVIGETNEVQEYNFNYDPNKSTSENGEVQDHKQIDDFEQINQEKEIDSQNVHNQNIILKSILKTSVQIPTVIGSDQIQVKIEQNLRNVEDDINNMKSNFIEQEEEKNKGESSDNEFDFTRFSKSLEQESQIKQDPNQYQQLNNNTENVAEEQQSKLDQ